MIFGGQGFMESQDGFCECVDKEELVEHYKGILEGVYKEHAVGKTEEEIESTLSKALGEKSLDQLRKTFYRVLKKYGRAKRAQRRGGAKRAAEREQRERRVFCGGSKAAERAQRRCALLRRSRLQGGVGRERRIGRTPSVR
jgi:hypothetical protein